MQLRFEIQNSNTGDLFAINFHHYSTLSHPHLTISKLGAYILKPIIYVAFISEVEPKSTSETLEDGY